MFNYRFITDSPISLSVKEFLKSVNIRDKSIVALFLIGV